MECEIWFEEYNEIDHKPLFISCGHTFCLACLTELKETREDFTCPSWNAEITSEIDALPVNYSILSVKSAEVVPPEVQKADSEEFKKEAYCTIHP